MINKKDKILNFLTKTGKSYSCKSAAKVLHLNEETTRKYLRQMHSVGAIDRIRKAKQAQRYFVKQ